ncbi:hypothetical protein IJG26_00975 [Candidatus Saccharibacteria bacterium]|nr:hypothetical protein [Candidatus Saccharibacteria bacterium]
MAEKAAQKSKNNLIFGIIALIAILVIVIVVIFAVKNANSNYGESYFASDDTKYVINLEDGEFSTEDSEHSPTKVHLVYFRSGDDITGVKYYYEYIDEKEAKSAYDYYKSNYTNEYDDIELNGKFIILTANKSDYEGMTAYDVQQQIEFMEQLHEMDSTDEEDISGTAELEEEIIGDEEEPEEEIVEDEIVEEEPEE